jgi:hypothetical protein
MKWTRHNFTLHTVLYAVIINSAWKHKAHLNYEQPYPSQCTSAPYTYTLSYPQSFHLHLHPDIQYSTFSAKAEVEVTVPMYGTDLVLMMYCVTSPLSPLWWSQEEDHSFSLHLPVAPDLEGGGINLSPLESAHYWKHTIQIRLDRELSNKGGNSAGANSISLTH